MDKKVRPTGLFAPIATAVGGVVLLILAVVSLVGGSVYTAIMANSRAVDVTGGQIELMAGKSYAILIVEDREAAAACTVTDPEGQAVDLHWGRDHFEESWIDPDDDFIVFTPPSDGTYKFDCGDHPVSLVRGHDMMRYTMAGVTGGAILAWVFGLAGVVVVGLALVALGIRLGRRSVLRHQEKVQAKQS